jgi:membrane-associated protease RseP (regulator of RpoE activity)
MRVASIKSELGFTAFLAATLVVGAGHALFADEPAGGIGVVLRARSETGQIEISQVLKDSPAAKAGLREGAILRAIDDVSTDGMALDECVQRLRGPSGTPVTLAVSGLTPAQTNYIKIIRAELNLGAQPVPGHASRGLAVTTDQVLRVDAVDGGIALIQFTGFTSSGEPTDHAEETATYRWRYRPFDSQAWSHGTNVATNAYSAKPLAPARYELKPKGSYDDMRVKAGGIRLDWSYAFTNKGYIYPAPEKQRITLLDPAAFDSQQ